MTIENTILNNLMHNEMYMRKVFPFLKQEYFSELNTKIVYKHISEFINTYNALPTRDALQIAFHNDKDIPEDTFSDIMAIVDSFAKEDTNLD